jgi:hypothetical protein
MWNYFRQDCKPPLKKWKLSVSLIVFLFLCEDCAYYVWKKQFKREEKTDDAQVLSLLGLIDNPNQALYSFVPGLSRNIGSEQFIESNFITTTSAKPKIVFIHGWNPLERDTDPFTSRTRKIDNIKGTFLNAIIHFQENQGSINTNFDLYLFTYRTSSGVVFNGEGFLTTLKKTFLTSERVIVIAHSMGGLVTRSAMKSQMYVPGLIDGVITLGSPMYGSPFASKTYLRTQSFVSELSSFLIETQGGADLSYTNTGVGQTPIENEKNLVLDYINDHFPYNDLFISYSGILSPSCDGAETFYYTTSCNILTNSSPSFSLNDGIVPENSALLGQIVLRTFRKTGYDHSMMAFQTTSVNDTKSVTFFNEVVTQLNYLVSR